MTDQTLREVLHDRVADLGMPDLSAAAWARAERTRRRRRTGALVCVVAATVMVVGGVAVLGDRDPGPAPGPSPAPSTPAGHTAEAPDATYAGTPVWWSPDQLEENDLAPVDDSPLPATVDLGADAPDALAEPVGPAVAAFGVGQRVVLVARDGEQRWLDVSSLAEVTKENGYRISPVGSSMLSPGGEYLVFPQDDGLRILTLATGSWREVDTGGALTAYVRWLDDAHVVLPPGPAGGLGPAYAVDGERAAGARVGPFEPSFGAGTSTSYGLDVSSGGSVAQAWGMGVVLPVRDPGSYLSGPEFVAASVDGGASVLAIMDRLADGLGRYKQCCPVAGWLDPHTLVYESRKGDGVGMDGRLVAWRVGTSEFRSVARVNGEYAVASFARLGED